MRYVICPPDITLVDPATGKPTAEVFSLRAFLKQIVNDPKFCTNYKALCSAQQIVNAPDINGVALAIESTDWDLLKTIVEAPSGGYKPGAGLQILPFVRAIIEATEVVPTAPSQG